MIHALPPLQRHDEKIDNVAIKRRVNNLKLKHNKLQQAHSEATESSIQQRTMKYNRDKHSIKARNTKISNSNKACTHFRYQTHSCSLHEYKQRRGMQPNQNQNINNTTIPNEEKQSKVSKSTTHKSDTH